MDTNPAVPAGDEALLAFERCEGTPGVAITDHVERRRCRLHTPRPVEPREAPTDEFRFPVDRGTSITTDRLSLPHTTPICVRNHAGWMIAELANGDTETFPADRYSIEISAPIKLYAVVESPLSVSVTSDRACIEFDEPTDVLVGARSYHKRPAATVTTTSEPEDVLTAVSYLGSALKTTTCERSYPTLRGHPPAVELGDELSVPSVLDRPRTGVTVELPPDYRSAFVAAPLAYYLGADVVPGDEPRIVTDAGFVHPLDDPVRGFEGEVERVLKQAFFLDCITRTEGYYRVDLHERNRVEEDLSLDFAALYDRPLREQLETYLGVPYSLVEPHLPKWKLTAHVELLARHVEAIPFLVNDLAVVRSPAVESVDSPGPQPAAVDSFLSRGAFVRSASRSTTDSADGPSLIRLEETDSIERTWIGDGAPLGASKATIRAFRNRIDRTPTDGDIDITVVCNDVAMDGERDVVDDVYGSRDELPFDVGIYRELTADELRAVLEEDADFLHYIGHIDSRGFECVDGMLDAATLDRTGVDAFFLNACTSYRQGLNLIEAGSVAGVVTLQDVINSGAERVGKTLARLLNRGFPLQTALGIAKTRSIMGGNYLVVGDGGVDIAQPEGGVPSMCEIETTDRSEYILNFTTYATASKGLGTITIPYIGSNEEHFLASGATGRFELTGGELEEFLSYEEIPIRMNGQFTWSDRVTLERPATGQE